MASPGAGVALLASVLGALGAPGPAAMTDAKGAKMTVYIGTYTGEKSKGIYRADFDAATGELGAPVLVAETPSPSFLAIDPKRRFLYAVNETGPVGSVCAYAVDPATGGLTPLNRQSSEGAYPCHVSVDATGRTVMVANYGNGIVASYPVRPDGSLGPAASVIRHDGSGPNKARQEGPHAHSIYPDPGNRRALAADLGADRIYLYDLNPEAGKIEPTAPAFASIAPGSGPRHIAFGKDGKHAYVINEMLSTITVCAYDDATGVLTPGQTVPTLPEGFGGASTTAEIAVHPSGRFVYGSNRGHDSLAIFSVNARTGRLTLVGFQPTGGKNPRSFAIDPTGAYLLAANQDSDSIVVFRIDSKTGKLTPTGRKASVGLPVCLVFAPGRQ
jgi:6-phosphogluconolactonase